MTTMVRKQLRQFTGAIVLVLGLGGCANTDGPVFGNWQGRQPSGIGINPSFVTLVLHGGPGATQGEYDIRAMVMQPILDDTNDHQLIWGDRWTLTPSPVPGAPPLLELHNLPNSQISRYALMQNGILLPATTAGLPDTSPGSLPYGLSPVSPSSRAYGRL